MQDMQYHVWADALQDDGTYWSPQRLFSTEKAAKNWFDFITKNPKYSQSKDACGGINFPREE
jgi:hypothetical protein